MFKRLFKIAVILFVVSALSVCALSACNKEKEVSSLQIVQGSFKESYALDEGLNLQNSKILVTYTDGSTANVAITEGMVSGFDTTKTTSGTTLTVSYNGKSVNFIYKVTNSIAIETSFRYGLEVQQSTEHTGFDISIRAKNADRVENGVYAMRFTISTTGGIVLSDLTLGLQEGFDMSVYSVSVNSAVIVIYSSDGYKPVPNDGIILKLKASKPGQLSTVTIQNASISDGQADYVVPAVTYTYGG